MLSNLPPDNGEPNPKPKDEVQKLFEDLMAQAQNLATPKPKGAKGKAEAVPVSAAGVFSFIPGQAVLRLDDNNYAVTDADMSKKSAVYLPFTDGEKPGLTDMSLLVVVADRLREAQDPEVQFAAQHLAKAMKWLALLSMRDDLLENEAPSE